MIDENLLDKDDPKTDSPALNIKPSGLEPGIGGRGRHYMTAIQKHIDLVLGGNRSIVTYRIYRHYINKHTQKCTVERGEGLRVGELIMVNYEDVGPSAIGERIRAGPFPLIVVDNDFAAGNLICVKQSPVAKLRLLQHRTSLKTQEIKQRLILTASLWGLAEIDSGYAHYLQWRDIHFVKQVMEKFK